MTGQLINSAYTVVLMRLSCLLLLAPAARAGQASEKGDLSRELSSELTEITLQLRSERDWEALDRLRAARTLAGEDFQLYPAAVTALKQSLTIAAARGFQDIAGAALDSGADPGQYQNGYTPLFWAAYRGDSELAGALLEKGAAPDSTNHYGMTALVEPVWQNDIQTARLLVKSGANVNVRGKSGAPLIFDAAERGLTEMVKLLSEAGANLNLKREWHSGEPVLLAPVISGDEKTVQALIAAGADINAMWQGKRMSWHARKNDKRAVYKMLRRAGAKR